MKQHPLSFKIVAWSVASAVLAVMGFLWFFFLIPTTDTYYVTERYALVAKDVESEVRLAVMVPKTGPYQEVSHLALSWAGAHVLTPHAEVDVVQFSGRVPAGQTNTAVLNYRVTLWQGRARWTGPVAESLRLPETGIESEHPSLIEQSRRLTSGQGREDAYRLFAFSADHLSWPRGTRINVEPSAAEAYGSRVGGCAEFANLAVALCRAARIPARTVVGLLLPASLPLWSSTTVWNHPGGAHAWIEFHAEEWWHMADPSAASLYPVKRVAFGRTDGRHLSYGERAEHDRVYQKMAAWAGAGRETIGAMSAPISFAASAARDGVSVRPEIRLQKGFWDARWLGCLAFVATALLAKWWRQRRREAQVGSSDRDLPAAGAAAAKATAYAPERMAALIPAIP
jgi:hypothetical protein